MPKLTVLEMTQDILSDMDSDEVNDINDTTESLQVAQILKTTYYEILDQRDDWDFLGTMGVLTASGDSAKPTHMTIPTNINKIDWIKYNKVTSVSQKQTYSKVFYKEPDEFMDILNSRDSTASTVTSVTDSSGVILLIRNDKNPQWYTTFDDNTLVFDSYYSTLDTTLQSSKTQFYGYQEPTFTISNSFTPDLPAKVFSYYLAEAKSVCFNTLKQLPNAKEEQKSRRQRYNISRDKRRAQGGGIKYPDYGRRGRK